MISAGGAPERQRPQEAWLPLLLQGKRIACHQVHFVTLGVGLALGKRERNWA
jgi:hypothetical protein